MFIKMRQFCVHVGDPPKKPTTKDKIKLLSIQKVGPKNGQPGVIGLKYFIVSSRIRKCHSQYVLLHLEK